MQGMSSQGSEPILHDLSLANIFDLLSRALHCACANSAGFDRYSVKVLAQSAMGFFRNWEHVAPMLSPAAKVGNTLMRIYICQQHC
jgi:hypothetical protein